MLKLLFLLAIVAGVACADDRCYFPDGSLDTQSFICNTTAVDNGETSACCSAGDDCYDSGTCFQGWSGIAYRNSCTDPTWKSATCPQFCLESDMLGAGIWIQSCSLKNKTACCSVGSGNCCDDTSALFTYAPGILVAVLGNPGGLNRLVDNSSATTTGTCSSAISSSVTAPAAASTGLPSSGSTQTNVAAIATGTALGVAFIMASAGLLYFRKKYNTERQRAWVSASAPASHIIQRRDPEGIGSHPFKSHQLDSTETARYPELQG